MLAADGFAALFFGTVEFETTFFSARKVRGL